MTTTTFSSLALVTATVLYLLAFCLHSIEWSAARKIKNSDTEPARKPELVDATATAAAPGRGPTSATDGLGTTAGAPVERLTPSQRTEVFGRMGVAFTIIGLGCAVAGVVARGLAAGRWPLGNMFEFTTMAMVLVVAAYLVLAKLGMRWLGLPVTLLATIGNGLAVTVFYVAVSGLVPSLNSYWFIIHITAAAISGAAFNVGGLISIVYLLKRRAEAKNSVTGYLSKLPESRHLDVFAFRMFAFAFPLWTFTIAAGAVWAEYAWGRYWGWDPKEVWALVTWVVFACYLHARSTAGWKGPRAAILALLGVGVFWFNFIGVNLLFAGLHSYAGI